MKKTFALLATGAAIAFTSAAHANDERAAKAETSIEHKDNGGFEKETSRSTTDAAGTTHSSKTSTDVERNDDGSSKKVVEKETTTDPKGLMNKTKNKARDIVKTDAKGRTTIESSKTVDGETIYDSKTAR